MQTPDLPRRGAGVDKRPPDPLLEMEQENRSLRERVNRAELMLDLHDKIRQLFGAFQSSRRHDEDEARSPKTQT
jgi:hypothetical protein